MCKDKDKDKDMDMDMDIDMDIDKYKYKLRKINVESLFNLCECIRVFHATRDYDKKECLKVEMLMCAERVAVCEELSA